MTDQPAPRKRAPGGGRKPTANPLPRVQITLSVADRERLSEIGEGNVSRGIRRLIEKFSNP